MDYPAHARHGVEHSGCANVRSCIPFESLIQGLQVSFTGESLFYHISDFLYYQLGKL